MKTVLYKEFDFECDFYIKQKDHPFGECSHPGIFLMYGMNNHWIISCKGCTYKMIVKDSFEFKSLVLETKLVGANVSSNSNGVHEQRL